jgi:hypothetical protein
VKAFVMEFKHVDWFDVFLFGGWMVCGFIGGIVSSVITAAFYQ